MNSHYGSFQVDVSQDRQFSLFCPGLKIGSVGLLPVSVPISFIDAIHFSVCHDSIVSKLAAYVVLGINEDGCKEVCTPEDGENENSKYWVF